MSKCLQLKNNENTIKINFQAYRMQVKTVYSKKDITLNVHLRKEGRKVSVQQGIHLKKQKWKNKIYPKGLEDF